MVVLSLIERGGGEQREDVGRGREEEGAIEGGAAEIYSPEEALRDTSDTTRRRTTLGER
jgi:hypothetical protein